MKHAVKHSNEDHITIFFVYNKCIFLHIAWKIIDLLSVYTQWYRSNQDEYMVNQSDIII